MFYGTGKVSITINLTVGHWYEGTKWAPCIDKCQNYFYVLQNCSAPSADNLPGLWLSVAQLQVTSKHQEMVQVSSTPWGIPLQKDSSVSWTCKCSQVCKCFISYTTQPNINCFTLHLRTRLLLKTQAMCYTVKNLSLVSRDCARVTRLLTRPGTYSPPCSALPSDNTERAISHPRFYTLWHAKVNQSIGTYKLG